MIYPAEMVRQVIAGSEAIDLMKKQIDLVVHTLRGYVSRTILPKFNGQIFRFEGGMWIVDHNSKGHYLVVTCRMNDGPSHNFSLINDFNFSARHTILVHAALPILLEGMVGVSSDIADRMEPLLEAAKNAK